MLAKGSQLATIFNNVLTIILYVVPICPPFTAPDNGDIDCSLGGDGELNPGDTCTFTCDDGYELGGSTIRTCGSGVRSWSGTDTTCTKGMHCGVGLLGQAYKTILLWYINKLII